MQYSRGLTDASESEYEEVEAVSRCRTLETERVLRSIVTSKNQLEQQVQQEEDHTYLEDLNRGHKRGDYRVDIRNGEQERNDVAESDDANDSDACDSQM